MRIQELSYQQHLQLCDKDCMEKHLVDEGKQDFEGTIKYIV